MHQVFSTAINITHVQRIIIIGPPHGQRQCLAVRRCRISKLKHSNVVWDVECAFICARGRCRWAWR
eukprot:scaffold73881_cov28-Prasinocladus_malaysianus.AAC.3